MMGGGEALYIVEVVASFLRQRRYSLADEQSSLALSPDSVHHDDLATTLLVQIEFLVLDNCNHNEVSSACESRCGL
jgi:hypothetical protein